MLWVLGGSAPFQLLVSGWLIVLLLVGFLMTVPYGLSRLRGGEQYGPPRGCLRDRAAEALDGALRDGLLALAAVGRRQPHDIAWNYAGRRWISAHAPPEIHPLEAEIRHSVDNDPGWWAREP